MPLRALDSNGYGSSIAIAEARGAANGAYRIADSDLGAILRLRETASNAGGETTVWSARYVGPVVSAQAAAAVLTSGETRLRNAKGSTLALAKLSGAARAAGKRSKVTLRRSPRVKGKLAAWACPATITAGATPPRCSAKVTLRESATPNLPPATAGKVRVVVVRSALARFHVKNIRAVDAAGGSEDDGHVPRLDSGKTLTDQVDEIEKLIFDAQQQLSQATYALDTLKERLAASSGGSERPDD